MKMGERIEDLAGIIARAIKRANENPDEFMVPGITKYTENYGVLRELYDGLILRISKPEVKVTPFAAEKLFSARTALEIMEYDIKQAQRGCTYHRPDFDRVLNDLAIAERQCFPDGYY